MEQPAGSRTNLSVVGTKMNRLTGVREIMKDIARAILSDPSKKWLNLSPGNPLVVPELLDMWREYSREIVESEQYGNIVARYGMTQGYEPFIEAVVDTYNKLYGWGISSENVLITAGSQSLYFLCANLWSGPSASDGTVRKLALPMVPDYTGYDGVVLDRSQITSFKPIMEILGEHEFKYGIDLNAVKFDRSTAAILCSRPCNPTGNVLTDDEMRFLSEQAKSLDIPLIVDSAYAPPFPNLAFVDMNPIFNENVIHCVSLSKAGLAGERVGFAIAHRRYIEQIEPFLSNAAIHSSRFGQALATKAFRSGKLVELSARVTKPLYQSKAEVFRDSLHKHLPSQLSWYLHRCEGGMFSWLWVESNQMNDLTMYESFKSKGLLCVPGSGFFPGLSEDWSHRHRCLRFSMTASDDDLRAAAKIVGEGLGMLAS